MIEPPPTNLYTVTIKWRFGIKLHFFTSKYTTTIHLCIPTQA